MVRGGPRAAPHDADLPLDAVRIGHIDGDLYDPRCMWLRRREIAPDGAVLVRPDRFVAWRSLSGSESPPRTSWPTPSAGSLRSPSAAWRWQA